MRLTFAGIPPAQSREIERRFRGHNVLIENAQQDRRHRVRPCDLLVINIRLCGHAAQQSLTASGAGAIVIATGPSSAIRVAEEWLAKQATNGS